MVFKLTMFYFLIESNGFISKQHPFQLFIYYISGLHCYAQDGPSQQ